jgi:phosphoenolpyruvate carboxykinase (GTP)
MATEVTAPSANESLLAWVSAAISLCEPDDVHWCDGSTEEYERLCGLLVETGTFERLSEELRPNSYLARSHPGDVARVEDRTFICSEAERDAGRTNNWRDPREMRSLLRERFSGAVRGRTMYVVPFSMGPLGSPASRLGVQLTDSAYAVVSMRLMTRMGMPALEELEAGAGFVPCMHTVGAPGDASPWPCDDDKYIVHFPETRGILARRPRQTPGRRVPERMRQDQPRHARADAAGLARRNDRRRHRVDPIRRRRPAAGDQRRGRH